MLLHVRIDTSGAGHSMEAAQRNAENKILQKNLAIESLIDPSVDPSPDTRPNLTYCNRRVVYGKGTIDSYRWPLSQGADVCEACQGHPSVSGRRDHTYIRDDQTAPMQS
jgi:hypothetical protein